MEIWWLFMGSTSNLQARNHNHVWASRVECLAKMIETTESAEMFKQKMIEYLCTKLRVALEIVAKGSAQNLILLIHSNPY